MKLIRLVIAALFFMASSAMAESDIPAMDLQNGAFGGAVVHGPQKEFQERLHIGGKWIGTWNSFLDKGYFVQSSHKKNMAGVSLNEKSWPSKKYGFSVYQGKISFGINSLSTLEKVMAALREEFKGNFVVTMEEERAKWNRQFIAYQLTGWRVDPPFYFEIFFTKEKKIDEIRLKSFPGDYYPRLLMERATGPDAVYKNIRP